MRIEILKYLSDSNDYKPLNEFIKSIYHNDNYDSLNLTLAEMYNSQITVEQWENIIYLSGDYYALGKEFYIEKMKKDETELDVKWIYYPSPMKQKPKETYFGTLDNCPFSGRISAKGRKELAEYELQQSIQSTNNSVKRTNDLTLIIAGLATLFSLTSVVIAITKSEQMQVPQLQQTNILLQKQSQTLESLRQSFQRIDSLSRLKKK